MLWVSAKDTEATLKTLIAQKEGYSSIYSFYILHEGKVLREGDQLRDCQIIKNSTVHVLYRLRGGSVANRGTAGPSSYKDAARSKGPQPTAAPPSSQPKPYIVEKLDVIPSLEVKNTEVTQLFSTLQTHALICRFNGFWPRSFDLLTGSTQTGQQIVKFFYVPKDFLLYSLNQRKNIIRSLSRALGFGGERGFS